MDGIHSGEAKDSDVDTYIKGGSGEDDIDTEDGSGKAWFQYGDGGKEGVSNMEGGGGEDRSGGGIIYSTGA